MPLAEYKCEKQQIWQLFQKELIISFYKGNANFHKFSVFSKCKFVRIVLSNLPVCVSVSVIGLRLTFTVICEAAFWCVNRTGWSVACCGVHIALILCYFRTGYTIRNGITCRHSCSKIWALKFCMYTYT